MDSTSVKRRLTCILAADAVGYSKLVSEDEAGTLRVLAAHRSVIDGVIAYHDGRIVSTAGDSVLAEFGSAVEAVRCAVEIQDALRTRNESLPEGRRLLFRVGVNLGDVVVRGADLLGDGVNIAARLESIAPPGGIVISSSVYDQITGKLDLGFHDIGPQTLKNITHPVRAFSVSGAGGTVRAMPAREQRKLKPWKLATAVLAIAIVTVGAAWKSGWLAGLGPPSPAAVDTTAEAERSKLKAEVAAAEQARAAAEERARTADAEAARSRAESEIAALKAKAQTEATAVKARAEAEAAALRSKSQAEAQTATERSKAANDAAAKREKAVADAVPAKPQPSAEAAAARARSAPATVAGAPASTFDPASYDGTWVGRMTCNTVDDVPGGTAMLPAAVARGYVTMNWPVMGTGKSAHAEGMLNADGTLTLRGSGVSRAKRNYGEAVPLRFDGALADQRFELRGHIGPRTCTLTLTRG